MERKKFIQSLLAAADAPPAGLPANTRSGPILPLPTIGFGALPLDPRIKQLMQTIMRSATPYDADNTGINSEVLGAMRQIHTNQPCYLPIPPASLARSERAKLYDQYVSQFKGQSNKRGGGSVPTGMVEYTAGDLAAYAWGGNRMRIVFNYLQSTLYYAPLHYAAWDISGATLAIVDKPDAASGRPNPFFWIRDIK